MTNRISCGSAPASERDANRRPGSFKPGHKKQGGRKRGTPNALTADYQKERILEAAYRVGEDGNGKDGLIGYFKWVAISDPRTFIGPIGIKLMLLQCAETNPPEPSLPTMEEVNQSVRDYVGLTGKEQTKKSAVPPKSRAPSGLDRPRLSGRHPDANCRR